MKSLYERKTDIATEQSELLFLRKRVMELEHALEDRHDMETALRNSEKALSALLNAFQEAAFLMDTDGVIAQANQTIAQQLGIPTSTLIGSSLYEVVPANIADNLKQYVAHVVQSSQPVRVEETLYGRSIDTNIYPVLNKDGQVTYIAVFGVDLTERKQVEEALRESEERFRTIANFAYDWEYWMAPDGSYRYISPSCERITGYRPEEFIAEPGLFGSIVHLDDCARVAHHIEQAIKEAVAVTMQFRIITRNGDERWISHVCQPVYSSDGTWLGQRASNRDITDQVRTEEAYRLLVEHSMQGLVIIQDGNTVFANPATTRITGYTAEELKAMSQDDAVALIHPDDRTSRSMYNHTNQHYHEIPSQHTFRFIRKDGRLCHLEAFSSLISYQGKPAIQVAYIDVTERVQVEEALRASEERYRHIVETADEGIWMIDANNKTTFVNRKMAAMLGYTINEMIGQSPFMFMDEDTRQSAFAAIERMGKHVAEQHDVRLCRKDGSEIWALISASSHFDMHGNYTGMLAMITDITERKHIEQALENSFTLLHATIESTLDGIVVGSQDGNIVTFNHKFEELWNLPEDWEHLPTRNERISLVLDQVTEPHHFIQWFQDLSRVPEASSCKMIHLKDQRVFECYSTPYCFGNTIAGRVWSYRDITERAHAEAALRERENRLQTFFNTMDDFVFVFDVDGFILHSNPAVERRLGYSADELHTLHMLKLYPPEMHQEAVNTIMALLTGEMLVYTIPLVAKDGTRIPVQTRVTHGSWANQDVLFAISRDITELKRVEDELQQTNRHLRHSLNELKQRNESITLLNEMGDCFYQCQTLAESYPLVERYMVQLFPEQDGVLYLLGQDGYMQSVATWGEKPPTLSGVTWNDCWVMQHGQCLLVEHPHSTLQCQCFIPSGATLQSYPYMCVPMVAHGETMGILHLRHGPDAPPPVRALWEQLALTTASKLALELANIQLRERLRSQSIRDPLTGLFNRRYLDETLKRELERATRHNYPVGVIMLDVDHFKCFNDTYGHDGGDALLRALGTLLQSSIRSDDIACRYGGEEFTLILPGAPLDQTQRRAEQFRRDFEQLHVQHNGVPIGSVTASLGIAVFPQHGTTDEAVIKAADSALYQAKRDGRNRVCVGVRQSDTTYSQTEREV